MFVFLSGVPLLWMVQAAQLMKKLQNVSMIFMLPKNLLGESTTELCKLYFLFYSDLTSVEEVSSCGLMAVSDL